LHSASLACDLNQIWIELNTPNQTKILKTKLKLLALALLALSTLNAPLSTALAQGTAFTYQGRLNDGGSPAHGTYDFRFKLFEDPLGNTQAGTTQLTNGVPVTNGLFLVTIDFGAGIFTGSNYWLEVDVRTNGAASYTGLTPLQAVTPTPYAIFANTASNVVGTVTASQLTGTVGNGQLANSSITVNAGTGLSGGGAVALGGSTTLNNAGVTSLAGGGGVTVSASSGAVTLGSTATSADTPNAIVSRDGSGNFSAGAVTLAGVLNLPTNATIYSASELLLHSDSYEENFFAGPSAGNWPLTTGQANTAIGKNAMENDTSGGDNSALGDGALSANTSGYANTAVGAAAMSGNTNGSDNTALGVFALGGFSSGTSGSDNTAEGVYALTSLTTGNNNTANGYTALGLDTGGTANTADGYLALYANTTGGYNVADGYQALYSNTGGFDNTAVGENALYSYTGIGYNTALGDAALQLLTSGTDNIGIGDFGGHDLTTGSWNIDIGNPGVSSDDHTIKIGQQGTQTTTVIAGISGTSVSGGAPVYVTSSGQLGAVSPAFVHTASAGNIVQIIGVGDATKIDNPLCNGRSNAILIITAATGNGHDPDGHPFFLDYRYDGSTGYYWYIDSNGGTISAGQQFNVLVTNP
jgi:hypothetical protein